MSRAAVRTFLKAVQADPKLRAELAAAAREDDGIPVQGVLALAAAWGLEITEDDWRNVLGEATPPDGDDLSETDLQKVSGGQGAGDGDEGHPGLPGPTTVALPDGAALTVGVGGVYLKRAPA